MAGSALFWNMIAVRYARKPVPDQAIYERKLEITRGHLRPDMRVLEFGCGSGITSISHAPFVRSIHGIDSASRMIAIASEKAKEANAANASFERSSLEAYEAPAASFDAVLGLSVLHLLRDWTGAIGKVQRLLKPGGVFVSSTPCLGNSCAALKVILPVVGRLGLLPSVSFFTPAQLLDSLAGAGLVVELDWRPGDAETLFIVARKPA